MMFDVSEIEKDIQEYKNKAKGYRDDASKEGKRMVKLIEKENYDEMSQCASKVKRFLDMAKEYDKMAGDLFYYEKMAKTNEKHGGNFKELILSMISIFNSDMEWYDKLQEVPSEKVRKEMSKGEYSIRTMTKKEAKSLFLHDMYARFAKIVKRIEDKIGTVVESRVQRNENDSLDGVLIGESANAHLETIFAGGHNIQRLHFRTLLKIIK